VVPCAFVLPGGVCIAGDCDVFSLLARSTCFSGMIVQFALCAFVLLPSVSPCNPASATFSARVTDTISTTGVYGRLVGSISYCLGLGHSLGIFTDCTGKPWGLGFADPVFGWSFHMNWIR